MMFFLILLATILFIGLVTLCVLAYRSRASRIPPYRNPPPTLPIFTAEYSDEFQKDKNRRSGRVDYRSRMDNQDGFGGHNYTAGFIDDSYQMPGYSSSNDSSSSDSGNSFGGGDFGGGGAGSSYGDSSSSSDSGSYDSGSSDSSSSWD